MLNGAVLESENNISFYVTARYNHDRRHLVCFINRKQAQKEREREEEGGESDGNGMKRESVKKILDVLVLPILE